MCHKSGETLSKNDSAVENPPLATYYNKTNLFHPKETILELASL
jgi:hypothetical protein